MIKRFSRSFFWALVLAFGMLWLYLGMVQAGPREAVLVENPVNPGSVEIIEPGRMSFIAGRIMPDQIKLHRVFLGPRVLQFRFVEDLDQSEFLGLDESFAIQLDLRVIYKLRAAQLAVLFQELEEPDFAYLDKHLQFRLQLALRKQIQTLYQRQADLPQLESRLQEWLASGGATESFQSELQASGVDIERLIALRIYVPELNRYQAMLNLGERALLELKLNHIRQMQQARTDAAIAKIHDRSWLARMDAVGKMLRRYPHLREYLAMDQIGDQVRVMIVPQDKWASPASMERLQAEVNSALGSSGQHDRTVTAGPGNAGPPIARPPENAVANAANRADANGQFRDLTPP
ncbi:MAG: hypothetical protein KDK39_13850 [Leptospiraceae bacterium]|nr:hypothetical protein [Leptospiraceae bacterium]